MTLNKNSLRYFLYSLAAAVAVSGVADSQVRPTSYRFKQASTPKEVKPYSCTVFLNDGKSLMTVKGTEIHSAKDTLKSIAVNPTGISAMVVKAKKKNKGREADIYSLLQKDIRLRHFDSNKYGMPYKAVFLSDGRGVAVATDRMLGLYDTKKLNNYAQFPRLPFVPEFMEVSPNGYFLAVAAGDQIIIYNIEERKIRKTLDIGETITDIAFSPDSSELAVLTGDGVLTLYPTRTFEFRKSVDNLGEGIACAYNLDGKYIG
ncbi:MAG: WD40 repeat domain-containing protein, partial [Muribaculaceae bacterium]|nr:WD40 repeat domain-containing protein [Muribaculaceae bacterium]